MMEDLASAMSQAKSHAPLKGAMPDSDGDNDGDECPHCGAPLPAAMHATAAPRPPRR